MKLPLFLFGLVTGIVLAAAAFYFILVGFANVYTPTLDPRQVPASRQHLNP